MSTGPLNYKTPLMLSADTLTIRDVFHYNLVETSGNGKNWYFRPTTYAAGSATFAFYNHNFFVNIIQGLASYYDTVEIT